MKKMHIRIDPEGKTTVRVEGAVGDECLDFTRAIEKALGTVENRVRHEEEEGVDVRVDLNQRIDTNE
jgi:hypothetical protein